MLKHLHLVILLSLILILGFPKTGVNYDATIKDFSTNSSIPSLLERVDESRLQGTISHLQSYGNRLTWEKQWEAAEWIRDRFREYGVDTFVHTYEWNGKKWPNVIGTIQSHMKTNQTIMALAHLDSISRGEYMLAPGADDNGSGVAVVLEMARILKNAKMEMNVVFCVFSNEERGTAGSKAFVEDSVKDSENIVAVINLDILGYNRPASLSLIKAINAHSLFKYKIKAIYRTFRNFILGYFNGSNVVKVAGRPENKNLVTSVSKGLKKYSQLAVKEIVAEDCG
jgi:Zn-dependent M28 family amino/carboxypeptidase